MSWLKCMLRKTTSKRVFIELVLGKLFDNKTRMEEREEIFSEIGLSKGLKLEIFRIKLGEYYDKGKVERRKFHMEYKKVLAESNVRKLVSSTLADRTIR